MNYRIVLTRGTNATHTQCLESRQTMNAIRNLITFLALIILPASTTDAFASPTSSSRLRTTLKSPFATTWCREIVTTSSASTTQLYEQRTSTPELSTPTAMSSVLDKITTIAGKSASTLVSVSFFLLLAYQRDAIILTLWIGSILNAVSSKVAKKILNHERPPELHEADSKVKLKPSDGGMPSSHAMSLGFIGTVIVITAGVIPMEYQAVAGSLMSIYSILALRYRIKVNLHTLEQVIVGLVLGVGNALAWLKFAVGDVSGSAKDAVVGPVLSWVQSNWVSAETGLFPYSALAVPVVVGILVVGSFERRIALWIKNKEKDS